MEAKESEQQKSIFLHFMVSVVVDSHEIGVAVVVVGVVLGCRFYIHVLAIRHQPILLVCIWYMYQHTHKHTKYTEPRGPGTCTILRAQCKRTKSSEENGIERAMYNIETQQNDCFSSCYWCCCCCWRRWCSKCANQTRVNDRREQIKERARKKEYTNANGLKIVGVCM